MKEFVEKLISRLEEEHERCINQYGVVGGNIPASIVRRCMNITEELAEEYSANTPQKSANGWIPCSERLPKPYKDVLVCTDAGEVDVDFYAEHIQNFIGLKGTSQKAIAWQPLPEPYKPQESEWKDKVMKHFTNIE